MPKKCCGKFEPPEYGARTSQTTDGRAIAYSERERELAKNLNSVSLLGADI